MMETKTFGAEIKAVRGEGPGSFEAILSVPTLDRDGEIVEAKALEPLPDHITIDIDHGLKVVTTVGSGTPYYEGDVLKFKGTFASTALGQEVRTLVTEGHIRHMSVAMAFGQKEKRPDGITYITKATLLNAAITGIPANLDAAILTSKSLTDEASPVFVEIVKAVRAIDAAERMATPTWGDAIRDNLKFQGELSVDDDGNIVYKSADTDPDLSTPAPVAAVDAPAAVDVARGLAALAVAQAEIALS